LFDYSIIADSIFLKYFIFSMVATVYELNYSGSFHVLTTLSYAALSYYPSILSRLQYSTTISIGLVLILKAFSEYESIK